MLHQILVIFEINNLNKYLGEGLGKVQSKGKGAPGSVIKRYAQLIVKARLGKDWLRRNYKC